MYNPKGCLLSKPTPNPKPREYWLICAFVKPSHCAKVEKTMVVSEPIEKFVARNLKRHAEFSEFIITSINEIDERRYNVMKRFNPSNEGYFELLNRDYSKIVRPETEDGDDFV